MYGSAVALMKLGRARTRCGDPSSHAEYLLAYRGMRKRKDSTDKRHDSTATAGCLEYLRSSPVCKRLRWMMDHCCCRQSLKTDTDERWQPARCNNPTDTTVNHQHAHEQQGNASTTPRPANTSQKSRSSLRRLQSKRFPSDPWPKRAAQLQIPGHHPLVRARLNGPEGVPLPPKLRRRARRYVRFTLVPWRGCHLSGPGFRFVLVSHGKGWNWRQDGVGWVGRMSWITVLGVLGLYITLWCPELALHTLFACLPACF